MSNLIINGAVAPDTWTLVAADAGLALADNQIVPLATWLALREEGKHADKRLGVWLGPADDPALLEEDIAALPLIAVQFPAFTDGRGYSIGRLLRERHGYRGELRAFGDVGRDHLYNLAQVGFNAFEIKATQKAEEALAGLKDFSDGYQTTFARKVPLYRRRANPAATADSWAVISSPS